MAAEPQGVERVLHEGLPCWRLSLASGDQVLLAAHGGHALSWRAQGIERLYLSPHAQLDGQAPIRGGVPVCFPQFNQRGDLPKHGFARQQPWQLQGQTVQADCVALRLQLTDSEATRAIWHERFELLLAVTLTPGQLDLRLNVRNLSERPLQFTGALHSYLRVDDLGHVALEGLGDQPEWDAVHDRHGVGAPVLCFTAEFDRVYRAPAQAMTLETGQGRLRIAQDGGWCDTVVWNPGASKCAQLPDMPADGFRHMLCVEAARVFDPAQVDAGAHWQGGQTLTLC